MKVSVPLGRQRWGPAVKKCVSEMAKEQEGDSEAAPSDPEV